mmetsp:Transcript_16360/g.28623  ORF Transcript_16360/g.28623 Transcript_16360/m.28623 type:complete len:126 (+) Transcript_16360:65-442(+)
MQTALLLALGSNQTATQSIDQTPATCAIVSECSFVGPTTLTMKTDDEHPTREKERERQESHKHPGYEERVFQVGNTGGRRNEGGKGVRNLEWQAGRRRQAGRQAVKQQECGQTQADKQTGRQTVA